MDINWKACDRQVTKSRACPLCAEHPTERKAGNNKKARSPTLNVYCLLSPINKTRGPVHKFKESKENSIANPE